VSSSDASRAQFLTTRWSVVRAAGRGASPDARRALEELCRSYWYPLYAYVRRRGHAPDDARDLVQGFFASFLEHRSLDGLGREGGRFRSYLLGALAHFLSNEHERSRAEKRGGGAVPVPIELGLAESRYAREPVDPLTPERLFARKWALELLERVLASLKEEESARGRGPTCAAFLPFLALHEEGQRLGEAARALGLRDNAARVALHRLRARYRELLVREVAETVERSEDVPDEIRGLFEALGG
jgi:RNA polymerase sigma-70 factor (ECF subfamily)